MCTSLMMNAAQGIPKKKTDNKDEAELFSKPGAALPDGTTVPDAKDIPLGSGLADTAKRSILSRREQIRRAVEGA